jgi:hypothetical protein
LEFAGAEILLFPVLWDEDLLRGVAEFIEAETGRHRKGKRAFREA